MVDERLVLVVTRWEDLKILQTLSTTMKSGVETVTRRVGANIVNVKFPADIVQYQKNMGGVDQGDQHRVMGAGFANVAHFKKWYKKAFMGIADFCLLNTFSSWNLSVDAQQVDNRGGEVRRNKLLKWQFYATAAEELMAYIDEDEAENILTPKAYSVQGHSPRPITKEYLGKKYPHCMICSMEEAIIHKYMQQHGQ